MVLRCGLWRAIDPRKGFERRQSIAAFARSHAFNAEQTDGDTEFARGHRFHTHHLSQVLQVEASKRGHNVQTNARAVGITLGRKVESAAAEVPHAANFLEMAGCGIGGLDIDKAVDLHARLAAPFELVHGDLVMPVGENSLLYFVQAQLPQASGASQNTGISSFFVLEV